MRTLTPSNKLHYRQSQLRRCNAPENYPFYAAAVVAPLVYIGAVGHAAHWRQSIVGSIVSLWQNIPLMSCKTYNTETCSIHWNIYFLYHTQQIAVLSVVCFTAMGYVLHFTGIGIYNYNQHLQQYCTFDGSYTIMFSGSFIACLFWVNGT